MNFFALDNKTKILQTIAGLAQRELNATLNQHELLPIVEQVMTQIYQRYGTPRPASQSESQHLHNLGTLTINETLNHLKNLAQENSMNNYNQHAPHNSGAQLPFQQINPRQDYFNQNNAEAMLMQRINERNNLDVRLGAKPMHQQPVITSTTSTAIIPANVPGSVNVHPAVLNYYLGLPASAQQKIANDDPQFYQQIMATLQRTAPPPNTTPVPIPDSPSLSPSVSESPSDASSVNDSEVSSEDDPVLKHRAKGVKKERPMLESSAKWLSLDFRKDLYDIDNSRYVLSFPEHHNIRGLELQNCIIGQTNHLLSEPYIYLAVAELSDGVCNLLGPPNQGIVAKLIQERCVNGFIHYSSEIPKIRFRRPIPLHRLTISFLNYKYEKIPLNRLPVKKLSKTTSTHEIKLVTKIAHNLVAEDRINMYLLTSGEISVCNIQVLEVVDATTIITEAPSFKIPSSSVPDLYFEKVDIKCTLTIKLEG